MEFKKAKRSQAKMKIAIGGASGSGKTLSSLLMAFGLVQAEHPEWDDETCWDKICIIDTENQSGSLYVDFAVGSYKTGEYNTIPIQPPFEHTEFINAIHLAEQHQMEVVIIDSLSHAWAGEGGALDKQGKVAARTGNSYAAWRDITPEQNRLMDAMLQSNCHIIADLRAKTDYVQEKNDRGKTTVKNIGMGMIYRDQLEYEFTTVFMLDADHVASASKDRTGMFYGKYFVITPDTGKLMHQWLKQGGEPLSEEQNQEIVKAAPVAQTVSVPQTVSQTEEIADVAPAQPEQSGVTMEMVDNAIKKRCIGITPEEKKAIAQEIKAVTGGTANYRAVTDQTILNKLYEMYKGE